MLGVIGACGVLILAIAILAAQIVEQNVRLPAFLLPTLAMPGALPAGATPPHPIGNPGAWFGRDAYPPEAIRRRQEGRVLSRLVIDVEGRVRACRILHSTASALLDAGTCRVLVRHGDFVPAHDARGHAITAAVDAPPVRWKLED